MGRKWRSRQESSKSGRYGKVKRPMNQGRCYGYTKNRRPLASEAWMYPPSPGTPQQPPPPSLNCQLLPSQGQVQKPSARVPRHPNLGEGGRQGVLGGRARMAGARRLEHAAVCCSLQQQLSQPQRTCPPWMPAPCHVLAL